MRALIKGLNNVANFGSYGDTYGAIGGVIVLLVWLYITALSLLLGSELNAVLEHGFRPGREDADEVDPLEKPEGETRSEAERASGVWP
jgi:membrane protein